MKRLAGAIAAVTPLVALVVMPVGSRAAAGDIDLSAWSCKQFMSASKEDVGVILAWLDGYYKEEDAPPVINTEEFVANAHKLGEYCTAHPDSYLIDAADKLFQKE